MSRVACCSEPDCKGELAPQIDQKKFADLMKKYEEKIAKARKDGTEEPPQPTSADVTTGYFCTACGIIYEDIGIVDGIPQGQKVSGRIERHGELQAERARFNERIQALEAVINQITGMIEGDDTPLAKAIQSVIDEDLQEVAV